MAGYDPEAPVEQTEAERRLLDPHPTFEAEVRFLDGTVETRTFRAVSYANVDLKALARLRADVRRTFAELAERNQATCDRLPAEPTHDLQSGQ